MDLTRILWIEDNASSQFEYMATPVMLDGRFDLVIATSASEGMDSLRKRGPFGIVIVDVRLPAGDDPLWRDFAQAHGTDQDPCLGLELLRQLFVKDTNHQKFGPPVRWAEPDRFGVLTVENYWGQVQKCLRDCGINVYKPKTADQSDRLLFEIVEEVMKVKIPGEG